MSTGSNSHHDAKEGPGCWSRPLFRRGRWEASFKTLLFEHDLRANAFRVCREGKPLHTFPDHALAGTHQRRGATLAGREEHPLELVDDADHEADQRRVGLAAKGDLLDVALDMPFGVRAVAEEDHVADAIALRRHAVALEHD